ncbi:MAG: DUF1552 domain-containing protein [Pirellulales bacterium]
MSSPSFARRRFLKAAGVSLALPLLEATARGAACAAEPAAASPRRLVCINTTLGLHTPNLFPKEAGKQYELTPYLEAIREHRDDFTVISGLSHPEVDGGHPAELCFLTAAPHPRADNFKNTISLDQFICEKLAPDTRFPSLTLSSGSSRGLSFSRSGVPIPAEERPSRLFRSMFVDGTTTEIKTQLQRLQQGRSIMDVVREEAADFQKRLGQQDQRKLDEYFQAVRDVEQRLNKSQAWAQRPKPKVDVKAPTDVANTQDIPARVRLMFDMLHLALQTDSTRYVTFALHGLNAVPVIAGVTQDWHNLSHHGQDPAKLAELRVIELEQMKLLGELLTKLKRTREEDGTLLDNTIVMFGSNLGNASSHDNKNLPILVAGGGFRHGQHLAFDPAKPPPLCNLYVQFLHRLGVEVPGFASSNGSLSELAFA